MFPAPFSIYTLWFLPDCCVHVIDSDLTESPSNVLNFLVWGKYTVGGDKNTYNFTSAAALSTSCLLGYFTCEHCLLPQEDITSLVCSLHKLFVSRVTSQQHAGKFQRHISQENDSAIILRKKLWITLAISHCHGTLTPGQPVLALTLKHQTPDRADSFDVTGMIGAGTAGDELCLKFVSDDLPGPIAYFCFVLFLFLFEFEDSRLRFLKQRHCEISQHPLCVLQIL